MGADGLQQLSLDVIATRGGTLCRLAGPAYMLGSCQSLLQGAGRCHSSTCISFLPTLLHGAWLTICGSLTFAWHCCWHCSRLGDLALRRAASRRVYIQFIRGTPLLLQLFFIYYVLPYGGIVLTPFVSGVIGLTLNYAAYMAEVFRSGIQAIPKGQWEAGSSSACRGTLLMRRIILPQAIRIIVPAARQFLRLDLQGFGAGLGDHDA